MSEKPQPQTQGVTAVQEANPSPPAYSNEGSPLPHPFNHQNNPAAQATSRDGTNNASAPIQTLPDDLIQIERYANAMNFSVCLFS